MTHEYYNFLMHHGVKGQRWGVRRYQNEDGTLTKEGMAKYNTMSNREKKLYDTYSEMAKGLESTNNKLKATLKSGKIPWWQSRDRILKSIATNDKDIADFRKLAGETIQKSKTVPMSEVIKHKKKYGLYDKNGASFYRNGTPIAMIW